MAYPIFRYAVITNLEVPSEARPGELMPVTVSLKNDSSEIWVIKPFLIFNGTRFWDFAWDVPGNCCILEQGIETLPGETITFRGSIYMADIDSQLTVESVWKNPQTGMWIVDDKATVYIDALPPIPGPPECTIEEISAPGVADVGSEVFVRVKVRNTGGSGGELLCYLKCNGAEISCLYGSYWREPGKYWYFRFRFPMPSHSILCTAYALHLDESTGNWVTDDTKTFNIQAGVVEPLGLIVELVAPSEYPSGYEFWMYPKVRNIGTGPGTFRTVAEYDSQIQESSFVYTLDPGVEQVMGIFMLMPAHDISGRVYAEHRDAETGLYVKDDSKVFEVKLPGPPPDDEEEAAWWEEIWAWLRGHQIPVAIGGATLAGLILLWPKKGK